MATYLSAVPAPGRAGTAAPTSERDRGMEQPTEVTKWPWHLTNTDVIVRDPRHPDVTGEWPVTGAPHFVNGCTVITVELGDGGERVLVYKPTQRADVRAGVTYTAVPLMTGQQREAALHAMAEDNRADNSQGELLRFAALALAGWPEIFDVIHARVERHRDHATTSERRPA